MKSKKETALLILFYIILFAVTIVLCALIKYLQHHQCRYPLGDTDERPKYFCGKTRWSNYSYCEEHTRLCAKDGMLIK